MTEAQFEELRNLLQSFYLQPFYMDSDVMFNEFHHGLCVGCDCEAAALAKEIGYRIIAHPGYLPSNPSWKGSRGSFDQNDFCHTEQPFLVRDHHIVQASDVTIGTPWGYEEQLRSGTWATVRYAEKTSIAVVIFPDGSTKIRTKP